MTPPPPYCKTPGTFRIVPGAFFGYGQASLCTTSPSRLRRATSPCRRGLGSPRKVNGFARGSPTRGNGDDRRQWRKQGGAVGAAASKTQAERGGCWEPQPGLVERMRD